MSFMQDKELVFSEDQALTGNANSSHLLDGVAAGVLGSGEPMDFYFGITAKGASTPTIQAKLVGADDSGFATNKITIIDTGTLSDPALGPLFRGAVPQHTKKRYYRVEYTLGGGGGSPTFTADACLTKKAAAPNTGF